MTLEEKSNLRLRLSLHTGVDIGEVFPEAFLNDKRGAVLHSVCAECEFPHSNFGFVTRKGGIVSVRTSGLN